MLVVRQAACRFLDLPSIFRVTEEQGNQGVAQAGVV